MKVVYKLYILFLLLLVLIVPISFVNAAVIFGGKVYSGDIVTANIGGNFIIYGLNAIELFNNETSTNELHYSRISIRSDVDEIVTLRNNSCISTAMYNYCYRDSVVDFDNPKTFEDGVVRAGMSITIESLPNPISIITFVRNMSINSDCGIYIPMSINITNSGSFKTLFNYTEYLPLNTFIVSTDTGNVNSNVITFSDSLLINTSKIYTYKLANLDCESKSFNATYSFTTFNETITKNITDIEIIVNNYYNFTDKLSANKTNILGNETIYTWNITNTHPLLDIFVVSRLIVPEGIVITQMSPNIRYIDNSYYYTGIVSRGSDVNLFIKFYAKDYGNHTILNKGTISVSQHDIDYESNHIFEAIVSNVTGYIEINTSSNDSLLVSFIITNFDIFEKYYYIYGIIRGIGNEEPIYANSINPDSTSILATKNYDTLGKNFGNVTFVFDGLYRDKNTVEHKLYFSKNIIIKNGTIIIPVVDLNSNNSTINNNLTTTDTNIISGAGNQEINDSSNIVSTDNNNVNNTTNSNNNAPKEDLMTRLIVGLNNFLQLLFG
jgi:hypothetical protein